jgi:PAS domain S-box-containing protein
MKLENEMPEDSQAEEQKLWVTDDQPLTNFRDLFRQAPTAIAVVHGADHRYTMANPLYLKLVGLSEEALLGKTIREIFPEMLGQGLYEVFDKVFGSGEAYVAHEFPVLFDRQNGLERGYFNFVAQPLKDAFGSVTDILVHVYEITDRVIARQQLAASEAKYRSLFETMDQGYCILEMIFDQHNHPLDYRFIEINPMFEQQTGLKNAIGKTARELVPTLEAHWFEIYGKVALTGEPIRFINGSEPMGRWFEVYAFRVGKPEKRQVALLFTDITERRKHEEERARLLEEAQAARERAEHANQVKSQFLAMVSHELRTPLTSIKGFASTLLADDVEWDIPSYRRFIEIIDHESDKLRAFIDDLLDVALLQRGEFPVIQASLHMAELLREAQSQLQLLVSKHTLVLDVPDTLPPIHADKGRIVQVLTNIVDNSAKHSPAGTPIILSARQQGAWVEFRVTDSGKGIPPDKRESVFEAFYQLQSGKKGVGLGLAICKGIVEAHGGRIWVEDTPQPGTTIVFTLPIAE